METALRRQLGADAVDIDTRSSTCAIAFGRPVDLDFLAVESAAADANYVLTGLVFSGQGEVASGHCDECAGDVSYLVLPGTEQRLELDGPQALGALEGRWDVQGWDSPHPVLVPLSE